MGDNKLEQIRGEQQESNRNVQVLCVEFSSYSPAQRRVCVSVCVCACMFLYRAHNNVSLANFAYASAEFPSLVVRDNVGAVHVLAQHANNLCLACDMT